MPRSMPEIQPSSCVVGSRGHPGRECLNPAENPSQHQKWYVRITQILRAGPHSAPRVSGAWECSFLTCFLAILMNLCIRAQGQGKGQEVRSLTQKSGSRGWARGRPGYGPGTTPSCQEIFYIGCWPLTVEKGWVIATQWQSIPKQHKCEPTQAFLPQSSRQVARMSSWKEQCLLSI